MWHARPAPGPARVRPQQPIMQYLGRGWVGTSKCHHNQTLAWDEHALRPYCRRSWQQFTGASAFVSLPHAVYALDQGRASRGTAGACF